MAEQAKTRKMPTQASNAESVADVTTPSKEDEPIIPKKEELPQYVVVKNGFHGKLVYRGRRSGERFIWDEFGAEQEMDLRELKDAKNANKKMFINNWFMFDDEWVIDYLGVRQYYKNAIRIEDFDNIFLKSPSEIKSIIGEMSEGQKRSAAYRARQLVNEGTIDSRKTISALEEALGIELIER